MERFGGFADAEGKFLEALAKKNQREWFQAHKAEYLKKKGFTGATHNDLKRVPRGFDPDHPRAEMLKWRGLTVSFPALPKGILATPELTKWLVDACKTSAPLVEWLTFATV